MVTAERLTTVFLELADSLVAEFDAIDRLHMLVDRSIELLPADAAGVLLRDAQGQLHAVASTSHRAQVMELFELQNHQGPCLDSATTGSTVANVGLDEARNRWPRYVAAAMEAGFCSTHSVPLRLRDQLVGGMNLFCIEDTILSAQEVALAEALANIATIALVQDRTVRHAELLAEQLQTALNSRIAIEQAKGVLMARTGMDVAAAFDLLRGHSRRTQRSIRVVAHEVIRGQRLPEELAGSGAP